MKAKIKNNVIAWLFILPSFLGIAIFYIIPYFICLFYSFTFAGEFTGLDNYIELFKNRIFLLSLTNTGVFTAIAIPLLMIISFLIALFLNSFKRVSSFFRSSFLMPIIIPSASLICVWQVVFDDYGIINNFLKRFNLGGVNFFEGGFSMALIILIYIWKNCGFCIVLFTAGLANVPKELYESARLDGASPFKIVKNITVPMITPTIFFVFLISIIYSFKIFREVFTIFGDYPNKNIYFLQNFINNNYYNLNFSRLSSASIVLSVIIILVILAFFLFERRSNHLE